MYPELISRGKRAPHKFAVLALLLSLTAALLAPSSAVADWDGGIQGGAVIRNGVQSNRLRLSLTNDVRPLSHYLYADWIINSGDDSYEAGYRPRYWFTDVFYSFGELTFRTDKAIGVDRETTESLGLGYQLLNTQTQSAFVEVAAGARQLTFSDTNLEDLSQPFGRARASYAQRLGEILRLGLDASTTVSDEITESNAEIGLTLNLNTFAVTLGYRVIQQRINGQPAISDDTTTLSFNYSL